MPFPHPRNEQRAAEMYQESVAAQPDAPAWDELSVDDKFPWRKKAHEARAEAGKPRQANTAAAGQPGRL